MFVKFCGGRKTVHKFVEPGEKPERKDENQQQTQLTCGVNAGESNPGHIGGR